MAMMERKRRNEGLEIGAMASKAKVLPSKFLSWVVWTLKMMLFYLYKELGKENQITNNEDESVSHFHITFLFFYWQNVLHHFS